jgi:hypothetical protein
MATKKATIAKPKKVFTTRKWNGDDAYSWAIFMKGQYEPVMSGLSMHSARATARQLQREHDAKQAVQAANK